MELGVLLAGQTETVVGAEAAHFQDLDRDVSEVDRRRRAGEMHDAIDLTRHPDVVRHVVLDEGEPLVGEQVLDVDHAAGGEIVEAHDFVASVKESFTHV